MNRREFLFQIFVLLALASTVVWIRTSTVKETYRFVQQEKLLNRTKMDLQALRLRWTRQTSPHRLIQAAKDLDLSPPQLKQVVRLSKLSSEERTQ